MKDYTIEVRIERDHGTNISVKIDSEKTEIEATEPYSNIEIHTDFDYSRRREIVEEEIGMEPDEIVSGSKMGPSSFYDWELMYRNEGNLEPSIDFSFSEAQEFVKEIEEELIEAGSTHHFS